MSALRLPRPVLCIDLGNTHAKATLVPGAEATPELLFAGPREGLGEALDRVRGQVSPEGACTTPAVSSVLDPGETDRVLRGLEPVIGAVRPLDPRTAMRLEVDPETVGADRLFAALGALELLGPEVLVVQVGTCLTVDAAREEDGRAVFLGGAIAPGPGLLARSLHEGTSNLPLVEPLPEAPALGRTTPDALRAGIVVGLRGAATALVEGVRAEAGFPSKTPVALTGGARELLLPAVLASASWTEDAFLVARGMARVAREADR